MPDSPVSIRIPGSLAALLEKEAQKTGITDIATLVSEILSSYLLHRREGSLPPETCNQQDYLNLRIESLQAALKKKDQEISALLELWHIRLGKEGETLTPDEKKLLEKKISDIQRDWYFDTERRDFSGADTSEGSTSPGDETGRPAGISAGQER
jgi:hypothetical protein